MYIYICICFKKHFFLQERGLKDSVDMCNLCIYTYTSINISVHMHIFAYFYTYIHIYEYIYIYTYTYIYIYICTYVYTYIYIYMSRDPGGMTWKCASNASTYVYTHTPHATHVFTRVHSTYPCTNTPHSNAFTIRAHHNTHSPI